jgi:hypothetical protein
VAPLAGLIAHGGLAGALVEGLVALAVAGILVAVWLRERRRGGEDDERGAGLRDDDEG